MINIESLFINPQGNDIFNSSKKSVVEEQSVIVEEEKVFLERQIRHQEQHITTLIGEGSYGCVFYPSLPGEGLTQEERKNIISKLMDETQAEIEFNNSLLFKRYDPQGLYGLYPYKIINPLPIENIFIIHNVNKCKIVDEHDNRLFNDKYNKYSKLLISFKGDISLSEWYKSELINTSIEYQKEIIYAFLNLCKGFLLFHTNGVYHHDIKSSNIMICDVDGRLYLKMIDFGLSNTLQNFETTVASSFNPKTLYNSDYIYYPIYNSERFNFFKGKTQVYSNASHTLDQISQYEKFIPYVIEEYQTPKKIIEASMVDVPKKTAWLAETVDCYGLCLVGDSLIRSLKLTPIQLKTFHVLVMDVVIQNKCSTSGFIIRLKYWIDKFYFKNPIKLPVFDDQKISFVLGKIIDDAPIIDLSYMDTRSDIDSKTRHNEIAWMWFVNSKSKNHPISFFNAVHLFDAFLSASRKSVDVRLLGLACLVISKMNDFSLVNYLGLYREQYDVFKLKTLMSSVVETFNNNTSVLGFRSINFWMQKFSDPQTPTIWPPKLTLLVAWILSYEILDSEKIVRLGICLHENMKQNSSTWNETYLIPEEFANISDEEREDIQHDKSVYHDPNTWENIMKCPVHLNPFGPSFNNQLQF